MSDANLEDVFIELAEKFSDTKSLVRVVLSGRRRNMQTAHERIDMRPVLIKDSIAIQVSHSDGRQMTTKNYEAGQAPFAELVRSGYANILLEQTHQSISVRITKKGEALVHRESTEREQELAHDRSKSRLLDPSDPYLIAIGISDAPVSYTHLRAHET